MLPTQTADLAMPQSQAQGAHKHRAVATRLDRIKQLVGLLCAKRLRIRLEVIES